MAVGRSIKGITVEIGGDTTGLSKALSGLNGEIKDTERKLKDIDNLLKLDPTNTELLKQKQKYLGEEIDTTRKKLDQLKEASKQAADSAANYDSWKEKFKPLQEEADSSNDKLKELKKQMQELEKSGKIDTDEYKNLQQEAKNTEQHLADVKEQQKAVSEEFGNPISTEQYDNLQREIIETEEKLKSLESTAGSKSARLAQISEVAGTISDKTEAAGKAMLPATAAITGLGTAAIKTTMDFDTSMSKVAAVSGATGEDLDSLRAKAREMGAKTKFSASEAAEAMNYMAMAGWKTKDMLGGIDGIMTLAAASGEDLATTSDIVTDAMTAFGLTADGTTTVVKDGLTKEVANAAHFADVLAASSANSNTNVSMLGESFKYVAPVAGSLGYSIEDTAVALGLMANSGIKASQGGTALRTILTNMAKPSEDMAMAMDYLGISLENGNGGMKTLMEVMEEMRGAFGECKMPIDEFQDEMNALDEAFESGKLTEKKYNEGVDDLIEKAYGAEGALKAKYAATIAGKQGMSGLLSIVNSSQGDFDKLTDAIYNSDGAAQQMADVMQDNLQGELTTLMSKLQELAISFGEILMPVIRDVVTAVQGIVDKFNGLDDGTKETIVKILAIVAAIGPLLIGISKVAGAIQTISNVLSMAKIGSTVMSVIGGIKTALSGLFTFIMANPIVAIIAVVIGAVILLYKKCEWFRNAVNAVWEVIKTAFFAAWDKIKAFFTETLPNAWNSVVSFFEGIPSWWSGLWQQIGDFFTEIWSNICGFFTETLPNAWNSVVSFFEGIPSWWSGLWQQIGEFFENIWTSIMDNPVVSGVVTTIQSLWENCVTTLQGIWAGLSEAASGAWEFLKNTILGPVLLLIDLVTGDFESLKSDAQNIWTNIQSAAATIWTGIKDVIHSTVQGMITHVVTIITGFKDVLSNIWETVKTTAIIAWESLKQIVITTATNLKESVIQAFTKLKDSAIQLVINLKDSIVQGWANLKTATVTAWRNLKEFVVQTAASLKESAIQAFKNMIIGIRDTVSNIGNIVKSGFESAINFITSLPKKAVQWGADFINGIAKGIRDAIGNVTDAVSGVADKIRSFLHFSVPDEGPLTEYESWMPDFMKGLAKGIEKSKGIVTDAISNLSADMIITPNIPQIAMNMTDGLTGDAQNNDAMINAVNNLGDKVIDIMSQYFPQFAKPPVWDTDAAVNAMSSKMDVRLGQITEYKERGN